MSMNYKMQLAMMMNPTMQKYGGPLSNHLNDQRLASTVGNLEQRMQLAGVTPPPPQKKKSLVTNIFETLDRPRNAVASAIMEMQQGKGGNPLAGFMEGLKRERVTRGSDLLDRAGMDAGFGRSVAGFALDVGLDPMTYVGGALAKGAKTAVGKGMQAVPLTGKHANLAQAYTAGKAATKAGIRALPAGAGKTLGTYADDLAEWTGRAFKRGYVAKHKASSADELAAMEGVVKRILGADRDLATATQTGIVNFEDTMEKLLNAAKEANIAPEVFQEYLESGVSRAGEHFIDQKARATMAAGSEMNAFQKELREYLGSARTTAGAAGFSRKHLDALAEEYYGVKFNKLTKMQADGVMEVVNNPTAQSTLEQAKATLDNAPRPEQIRGDVRIKPGHGVNKRGSNANAIDQNLKNRTIYVDDVGPFVKHKGRKYYVAEDTSFGEWYQANSGRAWDGPKQFASTGQKAQVEAGVRYNKLMTQMDGPTLPTVEESITEQLRGYLDPKYKLPEAASRPQMEELYEKHLRSLELNSPQVDPIARKLYEDVIAPRYAHLKDQMGIETVMEDYITHLYSDDPAAVIAAYKKNGYLGGGADPHNQSSRTAALGTGFFADNKRRIPSDALAREWGLHPIEDIRMKMLVYESAAARASVRREMFKDVANMTFEGLDAAGKPLSIPMISRKKVDDMYGYVSGSKLAKQIPELAGMQVHPEVAHAMMQVDNVLTNVEELRGLLGVLEKVTGIWKGAVTAPNPAFHLNNVTGNILNNWLAGIQNPQWYMEAAAIQGGAMDIVINLPKGVTIPANYAKVLQVAPDTTLASLTSEQAMKLFNSTGVGGAGEFGIDLYGSSTKRLQDSAHEYLFSDKTVSQGTQTLKELGKGKFVTAGRRVGDAIETNSRLTHFLGRLKLGDTIDQAADSVNKYCFNYGHLTKFERNIIRPMLPFYTWTRKNIPLQIEHLTKEPQRYMKMYHAMQNSRAGIGMDAENIPDWLEDRAFGMPGGRSLLTPGLPVEGLNRLSGDGFVGMLNPLVKTPMELFFNTDSFSGKQIQEFKGQKKPIGIGGIQAPAKVSHVLAQTGVTRNPLARASVAAVEEGAIPGSMGQWARRQAQLGLIRDFDPENAQRAANYRRRDQLQDYRLQLRQGGIELPELQRGGMTPTQARLALAKMMRLGGQ